jgi:hypothetical protein
MQEIVTQRPKRKTAPRNQTYAQIRQDAKLDARKYVEGWKVPKGAE